MIPLSPRDADTAIASIAVEILTVIPIAVIVVTETGVAEHIARSTRTEIRSWELAQVR